jgi:large subunit ribosomal protein L9
MKVLNKLDLPNTSNSSNIEKLNFDQINIEQLLDDLHLENKPASLEDAIIVNKNTLIYKGNWDIRDFVLREYVRTNTSSYRVKVFVKTGAEGRLFGSVSMKQVVDAFEKETGIALDKRKINFEDTITSLGTYNIPIQLHKEVLANIKLFVVEKE